MSTEHPSLTSTIVVDTPPNVRRDAAAVAVTYISWAPHCTRSDFTARELGGTSHMVYWGRLGSRPSTVWLKYLGQTFETWKVLRRERPDTVFVMSPPPTAVLAVYAYCRLRGISFVIDAHSGVFEDPRWKPFWWLNAWLSRKAATTIVTNTTLAERLNQHGARATIVPDVPIEFPRGAERPVDRFTIVCVTSFDRDEPIGTMVEAARRLPDVQFLMTGNKPKGERLVGENPPPNLQLTGFVDDATYGALLRSAGAVMTLTRLANTMQRGAYEAIYQGTPVIVTDSPLLRDAFDEGAVHVDNSPEQVVAAIERLRTEQIRFRVEAAHLGARKRERWLKVKDELRAAMRRG